MFEEIEEANAADWKERILESKRLVVVEFWHQHCPHCRAIEPVYDELALEYGDRLRFTRLNVMDTPENQQLAATYGVDGNAHFPVFLWRKTHQRCCWSTSKRRPGTSNGVHHPETPRLHQEKHSSKFALHQLIK